MLADRTWEQWLAEREVRLRERPWRTVGIFFAPFILYGVYFLFIGRMNCHHYWTSWATERDAAVVEQMAEELRWLRKSEPNLSSGALEARLRTKFRRPLCGDKQWHFEWFHSKEGWNAVIEFHAEGGYPSATYYTFDGTWLWDT